MTEKKCFKKKKSRFSERQDANHVAPSGQQRRQEKGLKYRDGGWWGGSVGKEPCDQSWEMWGYSWGAQPHLGVFLLWRDSIPSNSQHPEPGYSILSET